MASMPAKVSTVGSSSLLTTTATPPAVIKVPREPTNDQLLTRHLNASGFVERTPEGVYLHL